MKQQFFKGLFVALFAMSALQFSACKDKKEKTEEAGTTNTSTLDTNTTTPQIAPPVIVSSDDSLNTLLKDAVKDYPGVETSVSEGEVTLTGTTSRAGLPKLLSAVNALHPKKVNNKLTLN